MAGLANLGRLATWRHELAPTPRRVQDTLRTTIACAVGVLLAQVFHMEQGFWAIITVLVLAPPTAAASLRKAATRLAGTAIGCLLGVGSIALFAQQEPLQLASIFVILTAGLYLATGPVIPYSFFVASFTMSIVTFAAVQDPQNAGAIAWGRFTEISLGVLVSGLSHLFLWPLHADAELRRSIADKIDHAARNLEPVVRRTRGEAAEAPSADPAPSERLSAQLDLLDLTAGLHERLYRRRDEWMGVIGLVEALRLAAFESGRLACLPAADRGLAALGADAEASVVELAQRCRRLAAAVRRERSATGAAAAAAAAADLLDMETAASPLERLDDAFTRLRASGDVQAWRAEEVSTMAATIEALRTAWSLATRIATTAQAAEREGGAVGRGGPAAPDGHESLDLPPKTLPPLFPLDGGRLRGAIKGSIAATISIMVGATLHWSLGVPATATCIVLATTGTLGSLVQKSGLRLLGSIVGGALAILVIMGLIPISDGPAMFVAIAFLFLLPCNWLLTGSDRINYLGLQAAFAFAIGVLGPLRPTVDLWSATSRILGIIVGIVVFVIVFALLWPTYATRRFRASAAGALRIIRDILDDGLVPNPSAPYVHFARQRRTYDAITATARLLGEAEYEDPGQLDLDRARGLELLGSIRLLCRSAILWRQARWSVKDGFPGCETCASLAEVGRAISARLEAVARAIEAGDVPPPDPVLAVQVRALDEAIARDRAGGVFGTWPTTSIDALFACVEHARAMTAVLERAREHGEAIAIPARAPLAYASAAS